MAPFTFSDGTHVPANNWIVVPQQVQMKDPANYPEPEKFDGFRFVTHDLEGVASESRLSHPSWRFPFWGSVKQAWSVTSFRNPFPVVAVRAFGIHGPHEQSYTDL